MTDEHGVRRQNMVYVLVWILYYAWVIVFTTWWTAVPDGATPFDAPTRSLVHGIDLLSSAAFVLIVKRTWFVRMARVGGMCIVLSMLSYLVVQNASVRLASALLLALSMGCVNIAILIPFVFAMNDSERLCSVAGSNALIYLLLLVQQSFGPQGGVATALSIVLLAASLCALLFLREHDASPDPCSSHPHNPPLGKVAYLALALSCVFAFLGRSVMKGLLDAVPGDAIDFPTILFIAASLAGAVLFFALHRLREGISHLIWNITFGFLAIAFVLYAFSEHNPPLLAPFALFAGLGNTMGMCAMYYLLGLFGNRFDSLRYVRLSIILIGVCGGIPGIAMGNIIASQTFPSVTLAVTIASSVAVLVLLTVSPSLLRTVDDTSSHHAAERNRIDASSDPFGRYGLSKRESEVCELLLQGYTMRQVAGKLSIAHSTVNTYCTSLYRKTGVNSRTELMLLFRNHLHD